MNSTPRTDGTAEKKQNVLLTGHTGFLGKQVHKSVPPDITLTTLTESQLDVFLHELEHLKTVDFDLILHLGAVANPQEITPRLWQMNVAATQQLLEVTVRPENRFLFMSSYAVYNIDTDYGYSKMAAERIVRSYYTEAQYCILRPVSIWGGDQSKKETPSIIDKFRNNELTGLFSNWYRDFIHIDDIVNYIVGQVATFQAGTFDLGTGDAIACSDFAVCPEFFGVSPKDVPPVIEHARASVRVADPKRFPPGWKPTRYLKAEMDMARE